MSGRGVHLARPGKATAKAAAFSAVMALATATTVVAQEPAQGTARPQRVDSVVVVGNKRVAAKDVQTVFGVNPGALVTFRDIQRGLKALTATHQFKDVVVRARGSVPGITLVLDIEERPLVRRVTIDGLEHASERQTRDTTGLRPGVPYDPQAILDAKSFIRAQLAEEGIPFASIDDQVEPVEGSENEVDVTLDVTEGQRVTVSQIEFSGNDEVTDDALRGAMSTKREGFWWFRSGSYDDTKFQADLQESIPALYHSRGFLDFRVVSDTVVVDPQTGKSRVEISVDEGPQYLLSSFKVEGNTRFDNDRLEGLFRHEEGGLLRSLGLGGRDAQGQEGQVFDAEAFNEAIATAKQSYNNEGYLYAQINPVIDRKPPAEPGGNPTVDASWQITEGQPALVNRVSVVGNDYTYEWVVRDRISILPGDVYSQDRVLQSYQGISALGFFEAPMPIPGIQPLDNGDVDITFYVKEKQTGSVNFGTSVGGGVGLSGFLGYEQPNLFGQAKSGSLRWDFGRYLNSFEISYSDPALFQSRVSGSISLFNSRDRFFQFTSGRRRRVGTNLRFGVPWPGARYTRLFLGYSISRTKYEQFTNVDDTSLFGRAPGVQSQLSVGVTRQTLDHPLFPTTGSKQSLSIESNGGILGGDGDFTKVLGEGTWYVPVTQLGDPSTGGRPIRFSLGLSLKAGAVFGNADAFPFDRFWMGGVQFGQRLRGYDETSITPLGFFPERSGGIRDIDRLGNAFFSMTAEYALRLNDQISLAAFYDAGNVWRTPAQIDPTKLFRGAGFGIQLVTPFGPIGLDYAYGFDKTIPGWQLHFRMGPGY